MSGIALLKRGTCTEAFSLRAYPAKREIASSNAVSLNGRPLSDESCAITVATNVLAPVSVA